MQIQDVIFKVSKEDCQHSSLGALRSGEDHGAKCNVYLSQLLWLIVTRIPREAMVQSHCVSFR